MLEKFLAGAAELALSTGVKIVVSILILIVGFKLIKWIIKHMKNGKLINRADPSVKSFTVSFCSVAFKVILLITVAAYLGVPMTSLITLLGSAAVAIGLALQGGLSNIASGLMIVFFRPFAVGDYIENGNKSGTVISIGLFHTTLNTPDNVHIVIPNSLLTSQTVINYSVEAKRRVDLDFSCAYSSDTDKVKKILLDTASKTTGVMIDPAPEAVMFNQEDSAVIFRLRAWCVAEIYWDVRSALLENVKRSFDKEGIEIPFPQLDVHLNGTKEQI